MQSPISAALLEYRQDWFSGGRHLPFHPPCCSLPNVTSPLGTPGLPRSSATKGLRQARVTSFQDPFLVGVCSEGAVARPLHVGKYFRCHLFAGSEDWKVGALR